MNIKVPYSWIKEHLTTTAKADLASRHLSACSQSVEKTSSVSKDTIFDIEITTNRPDCLSVYGICRELGAILPQFGFKATLKQIKETKLIIPSATKGLPLKVIIENKSLVPRFSALIFDQVVVGHSPKLISERLEKSGVRSLNNVVDISNYLMLELGQPMHTFDYDKIGKKTMIVRESRAGENLITLDEQKRSLPTGSIVIEDGEGELIDLCGIMGGANSAVDKKTKRVLLFVQTYDPVRIRTTCQNMAFRTEASQRFEKGVDPEGVIPALKKAVFMFKNNCRAKVASKLIDINSTKPILKSVCLSQDKLNQILGINFPLVKAKKILESLGFDTTIKKSNLKALVPHWRTDDINISEDLIEEIARINGYANLPSSILPGQPPDKTRAELFDWEMKVKNALKFMGFSECVNYSLISLSQIKKAGIDKDKCLEVENPLSEDWVYLRPTLLPSLMEVFENNKLSDNKIKIFELANIYIKQSTNKLPQEVPTLAAISSDDTFYTFKGILEIIFKEMGVENVVFDSSLEGTIMTIGNQRLGLIKKLAKGFLFELDFQLLVANATLKKYYQPISKYPLLIEDLTFSLPEKTKIGLLIDEVKKIDLLIAEVKFISDYKENRTFRFYYQSQTKNLTLAEAQKLRAKIVSLVKTKFKGTLISL